MANGGWLCTMVHYGVSPSDFATSFRRSSEPANEEQIVAQQWEIYEARGSPDTYDMVSGVVAYADEQLGQEVMSPEQWFKAMRHVREQIAPILTRRRGRGGGDNNMRRTKSRITCSCFIVLVGFRLC